MTRYFMRDTPLCQMEQQMMTPPYFKPRGHGRYYPGFQYSRDDMECPYCMNFRRNHPCPLEQCVCLDERIVAGAIDLNEFVRDCFFPEAGAQLQARLERSFNGCSIEFFLSDSHRERWQHWRARCYRMSGRNLAALFLLTAYEDIWRRMIWKFDARGFDFQSVQLSGIQPELYSVYQAAKAISTGSRNITLADLASPELVTDEAFHLIVCALLLAKCGDAILNFEGKYLPASKGQIERAMQRSGITEPKDMRLWIADSSFPEEVDVALDFRCDNIHELNELALAVEKFSIHDRKKLGAAVSMAKPENASQIRRLAENMDLFEFAPGAHTPAEYGKYMIQKSGHFEYDPNLDEFYDYERYGLQHMDYQSGVFTDRGYIVYVGTVDLEELMAEGPVDQCQREQEVQMGGMA